MKLNVGKPVNERVGVQVCELVERQIWEQFHDRDFGGVWVQVWERVGGRVGGRVWRRVALQVRKQVWEQLKKEPT